MNKLFALMVLFVLSFTVSLQANSADYTHRLSVSGGVLHSNDEVDKSFGVEYEFRPISFVGVGGGGEWVGETYNGQGAHFLFGTVTVHPIWGLRLSASLGEAAVSDWKDGTDSTFRRYGVGYDFKVTENFVVGPQWSLNRVNQDDTQTVALQLGFTL